MLIKFECPYCGCKIEAKQSSPIYKHMVNQHNFTREEYIEFLRTVYYPSLDDSSFSSGFCGICGKKTAFLKFSQGFSCACCPSHRAMIIHQNETEEARENWKNKMVNTMLDKYGVRAPALSKEIMDKARRTVMDRYGCQHVSQNKEVRSRIVQHNLEKYGVEYPQSLESVKQKVRDTNLEKYGVPYTTLLPQVRSKKNNRYSGLPYTNKLEEEAYNILCSVFKNVKCQFRDEIRYPYFCDFYIEDIDLFIEIQGTWLHGGHPFDPCSKQDTETLTKWQNGISRSSMYKQAIEVWTIKDVAKRTLAKENNLLFVEIFKWSSREDFLEQIDLVISSRIPNVLMGIRNAENPGNDVDNQDCEIVSSVWRHTANHVLGDRK